MGWAEVTLVGNGAHALSIDAGSSLILMSKSGELMASEGSQSVKLKTRDFGFEEAADGKDIRLNAGPDDARFHIIRVPVDPGYPLYQG